MLQINDLSFNAWGRRFFQDASARVPDGAKVGLVGRNGSGKSTLFKLILGELSPLTGEVLTLRSGRIATVAQEHGPPRSLCSTPSSPPMSNALP